MFELLTSHQYRDYMEDAHDHIDTDKEPEYSETLRDLITECIRPIPLERIELDRLRERIQSYRDRMHREYMETDDDGRAEFESENLLYYIRNEINNMPTTSELIPSQPPLLSEFPDADYPIFPPLFSDEEDIEDGPEAANDFWDEVEDGSEEGEIVDRPKPKKDLPIYERKRPDSKSPPSQYFTVPLITPSANPTADPLRHRHGHLNRNPPLSSLNDADDEWGSRFFRKRSLQATHIADVDDHRERPDSKSSHPSLPSQHSPSHLITHHLYNQLTPIQTPTAIATVI